MFVTVPGEKVKRNLSNRFVQSNKLLKSKFVCPKVMTSNPIIL